MNSIKDGLLIKRKKKRLQRERQKELNLKDYIISNNLVLLKLPDQLKLQNPKQKQRLKLKWKKK